MLHLYSPQHNAGAETTAHQLLKRLVARGHQVCVQLSRVHPMFVTGPYTYDGVHVYPYQSSDDPIRWLTAPEPPDLVISHLENTIRAAYLCQSYRLPHVVLMHNTHLKGKADLRHKTDLVVYNTEWMRADTEDWWRATQINEPPHGIVIHPPIFRNDYQAVPPTARNGYVTLINLNVEKGSGIFYELAARFPKLKFLGVTGAYGQQDVREGIPNVTIIPHVAPHDMVQEVYSKTRVLLMPSSYESYGRCGVEAACSGIPSIVSPTPGLTEALGECATFCELDDLDAWEHALRQLTIPARWNKASAAAMRVAETLAPDADLDRWAEKAEAVGRLVFA